MTKSMKKECRCCQYETQCKQYERRDVYGKKTGDDWLCELCAGTMTSVFDEYYKQHDSDSIQIMKTICYVGNAILDKLDKSL